MSQSITDISALPTRAQNAVVAIGNFDGVHKGHQEILRQAKQKANDLTCPLIALTFNPHPRAFFQPDAPNFRLSSLTLKTEALKKYGVDEVIALPFDQALSQKSAEAFIDDILVDALKANHIFIGEDFLFGRKKSGNVPLLIKQGQHKGFNVTALTQIKCSKGQVYSSTAIRSALQRGDIETATEILGHPWIMESIVEHGDKRGRELGYPTANMRMESFLHPAYGVYAVRVQTPDLIWHDAVANFGIRPMFATPTPLFEAHLIGFDGDLYDQTLRVEFVAYLRPEAKFDNLDSLIVQMDDDKARAISALSEKQPKLISIL